MHIVEHTNSLACAVCVEAIEIIMYYLSGHCYCCTGNLTAWTKCTYWTRSPDRKAWHIPGYMKEDHPYLYVCLYVCVCASVCVNLCVYVCLSARTCVLCVCAYVSVSVFVCVPY